MGKKKKRKQKQPQPQHRKTIHDYSYGYGYNWYSHFTPVTSKKIHDTAQQVFGSHKYISYEAFKSLAEYDIMGDHEKSNIQ